MIENAWDAANLPEREKDAHGDQHFPQNFANVNEWTIIMFGPSYGNQSELTMKLQICKITYLLRNYRNEDDQC